MKYYFADINALADLAVAVHTAWMTNPKLAKDRNTILNILETSADHELADLGEAIRNKALVADVHILESTGRVLVKKGYPEAMAEGWAEKILPTLVRTVALFEQGPIPWSQMSEAERKKAADADWKLIRDEAYWEIMPAMEAANELELIEGIPQSRGAIVAQMLPGGEAVPGDKRADIEDARMLARVRRAGRRLVQRGLLENEADLILITSDKAAAVAAEAIGLCQGQTYTRADGAVRARRESMDEARKKVAASHIKRQGHQVKLGGRNRAGVAWSAGSF